MYHLPPVLLSGGENWKGTTMSTPSTFNSQAYKETTRLQWQDAAKAWNDWGPTLREWLGPATDAMFDMARIETGSRVLDVAAGAGDQSLSAAERVGSNGHVLATDISSNILEFAAENALVQGCLTSAPVRQN